MFSRGSKECSLSYSVESSYSLSSFPVLLSQVLPSMSLRGSSGICHRPNRPFPLLSLVQYTRSNRIVVYFLLLLVILSVTSIGPYSNPVVVVGWTAVVVVGRLLEVAEVEV